MLGKAEQQLSVDPGPRNGSGFDGTPERAGEDSALKEQGHRGRVPQRQLDFRIAPSPPGEDSPFPVSASGWSRGLHGRPSERPTGQKQETFSKKCLCLPFRPRPQCLAEGAQEVEHPDSHARGPGAFGGGTAETLVLVTGRKEGTDRSKSRAIPSVLSDFCVVGLSSSLIILTVPIAL